MNVIFDQFKFTLWSSKRIFSTIKGHNSLALKHELSAEREVITSLTQVTGKIVAM